MEIDELTYGTPLQKDKTLMERDLQILPDIKSPERMVTMPSLNSSSETEEELEVISSLPDKLSDDDIRLIDEQDEDFVVNTFFKYADDNNLNIDKDKINTISEDLASIIMNIKYRFNRPRPNQLAPFYGIELKPRKGISADSPSYPSGHSAQATFLARLIGDENPEYKIDLMEIGEEVGVNRLKGNFHFPSDHEAGVDLGKDLYELFKVYNASSNKVDKEKQTKYI